jgi:hypothetical protein
MTPRQRCQARSGPWNRYDNGNAYRNTWPSSCRRLARRRLQVLGRRGFSDIVQTWRVGRQNIGGHMQLHSNLIAPLRGWQVRRQMPRTTMQHIAAVLMESRLQTCKAALVTLLLVYTSGVAAAAEARNEQPAARTSPHAAGVHRCTRLRGASRSAAPRIAACPVSRGPARQPDRSSKRR